MSIDVVVKKQGVELPPLRPGQMRFVFGKDGRYLERRTPMCTSSVLFNGPIPWLAPHQPYCRLSCKPIPVEMLRQMVGFFQAAAEKHGGEAALVLLHDQKTDTYRWHCPEQTVRMYKWWGKFYAEDQVEFENPMELPVGCVQFGDVHSHIGSPNPSYVDKHDEAHLDGLHIIVGNIQSRPSWHVDFAIDGTRFTVPNDLILESIPEAPFPEPPREWMDQIKIVYPKDNYKSSSSYGDSSYGSSGSSSGYGGSSYGSSGYGSSNYGKSSYGKSDYDSWKSGGKKSYSKWDDDEPQAEPYDRKGDTHDDD